MQRLTLRGARRVISLTPLRTWAVSTACWGRCPEQRSATPCLRWDLSCWPSEDLRPKTRKLGPSRTAVGFYLSVFSGPKKNTGHSWECNTRKQANVSKVTGSTSPRFQARTAPGLSPGAEAARSAARASLWFLFLVRAAPVRRATDTEPRIRRSWSPFGFNPGSKQQIFIKYTQKVGHYGQNQSIDQYEDFSLFRGRRQDTKGKYSCEFHSASAR